MTPPDQKKNNLRLALILASVAVVFFIGFMAKMVFIGR
ncbi:MAG: cytochrome oxidase small assembly protein [Pseudomonadota bacterium]